MNRNIKILIIFLIIILGIFISIKVSSPVQTKNNIEVIDKPIVLEENITKEVEVVKIEENKVPEEKKEQFIGINISLEVLGGKYQTKIKEGLTVLDAMNVLQSEKENKFSFHTKDYSSLGSFVDEINGIKGTPGQYWLYYINNKKASLGVSKYVLKDGDNILWKQEVF